MTITIQRRTRGGVLARGYEVTDDNGRTRTYRSWPAVARAYGLTATPAPLMVTHPKICPGLTVTVTIPGASGGRE